MARAVVDSHTALALSYNENPMRRRIPQFINFNALTIQLYI
jgi:hypothetical protein